VDRGQLGVAVTEVLRAKALDLLAERAAVTDEAGNPVDIKAIAAEARGEAEAAADAETGTEAETETEVAAGADAEAADAEASGAEAVSDAGPADAGPEGADAGAQAVDDKPAKARTAKAAKRTKAAK
jgi:trigger factor